MNNVPVKPILILALAAILPFAPGCSKADRLDRQFTALTEAVHAYCNTPPSQRAVGAKEEILRKFDQIEAELADAPPETRSHLKDKLMNQRCFVEMAH